MAVPEPQVAPVPPRSRRLRESDVTLSLFLVLLLASTVMAWPLEEAGARGVLLAFRLLTVALGVLALAPDRAYAIGAGALALAVGYGHVVAGDRSPALLVARLAFFAVVGAALAVRVFRPGRVTVHRLLGAVSLYVLLAVVWGTAYQLAIVVRPDAVRGPAGPASLDEVMWLSFVTITTTGYGDVLPSSALARSLAALEALAGVLYPAVLISRLVSLLQGPASRGGDRAEPPPAV